MFFCKDYTVKKVQSIKKVKLSQISEVLLTCYINDNFLLKIIIYIVIYIFHTLKENIISQ